MDFNAFKEAVIARCAQLGIEDYELYYQTAESTSVGVFQHEINQFTASMEGGVCFRCIVGGKMGYASTEEMSEARAVAIVDQAADNAFALETEEKVFLGVGGQEYEPLDVTVYDLPTTEELIAATLDTQEQLYAEHPAVVDGTSTQGIAERSQVAIYNSKGLDLNYVNHASGLIAVAVVSDAGEMSNDFQVKLGKLDTLNGQAMANKAVQGALSKIGGEPAPTGAYPVVFAPKAMADLLETFCGIFSSEAAQKGLSQLGDQEGQKIASEAVTIVDDPFHPENPCRINFDAEGSPTHRKNVVEQGMLNTLLYNLKTANVAGKKTTGNAAKGNYNAAVAVRPFTMYLAPGQITEAELLRQAGNGVYINALEGLHAGANAVSGDFSLQSAGFLIENGEKTSHVKGFTVAGNFYEVLRNITAVADNVQLPMALGMTAFGAPSVLVQGLSIAGK